MRFPLERGLGGFSDYHPTKKPSLRRGASKIFPIFNHHLAPHPMGITRRDWIKTASLSSGMALIGGNALLNPLQAAAAPTYTPRP